MRTVQNDDAPLQAVAPQDGETVEGVLVAVDEHGVLVAGDSRIVENYVDRLSRVTSGSVSVTEVSARDVANLAGAGASVMNVASSVGEIVDAFSSVSQLFGSGPSAGQYVKISPQSMELIRTKQLIPTENGYFLSTLRELQGGQFAGQLEFMPTSMGPAQMMSVEMLMMTIALRAAIASVEEAVNEVAHDVDEILKLVQADRIGDVLGKHRYLVRVSEEVEQTGKLSSTDWDSIAAMGPELDVTIAKLRAYVRLRLQSFEPSDSIGDRAAFLERLVERDQIAGTLRLLTIAEDAAYRWNGLRIGRIARHDPEHLDVALAATNKALRADVEEDATLLHEAVDVLNSYTEIKPLEFMRKLSARKARQNTDELRRALEEFAQARHTQLNEWTEYSDPGVAEAMEEINRRAKVAAEVADGAWVKTRDVSSAQLSALGEKMPDLAETRKVVERAAMVKNVRNIAKWRP